MSEGRREQIAHEVLRYITSRPGEILYLKDIAEAIEANPKSVQATINSLRANQPEVGNVIDVVVRGQAYRFKGYGLSGSSKSYSEVGRTKKGYIILQDEEGNLYKAQELE